MPTIKSMRCALCGREFTISDENFVPIKTKCYQLTNAIYATWQWLQDSLPFYVLDTQQNHIFYCRAHKPKDAKHMTLQVLSTLLPNGRELAALTNSPRESPEPDNAIETIRSRTDTQTSNNTYHTAHDYTGSEIDARQLPTTFTNVRYCFHSLTRPDPDNASEITPFDPSRRNSPTEGTRLLINQPPDNWLQFLARGYSTESEYKTIVRILDDIDTTTYDKEYIKHLRNIINASQSQRHLHAPNTDFDDYLQHIEPNLIENNVDIMLIALLVCSTKMALFAALADINQRSLRQQLINMSQRYSAGLIKLNAMPVCQEIVDSARANLTELVIDEHFSTDQARDIEQLKAKLAEKSFILSKVIDLKPQDVEQLIIKADQSYILSCLPRGKYLHYLTWLSLIIIMSVIVYLSVMYEKQQENDIKLPSLSPTPAPTVAPTFNACHITPSCNITNLALTAEQLHYGYYNQSLMTYRDFVTTCQQGLTWVTPCWNSTAAQTGWTKLLSDTTTQLIVMSDFIWEQIKQTEILRILLQVAKQRSAYTIRNLANSYPAVAVLRHLLLIAYQHDQAMLLLLNNDSASAEILLKAYEQLGNATANSLRQGRWL